MHSFHLTINTIFLAFTTFLLITVRYSVYVIFIMVTFDFVFVAAVVDTFTIIFIADRHSVVQLTMKAISFFVKIRGQEFEMYYFNQYLCIRYLLND